VQKRFSGQPIVTNCSTTRCLRHQPQASELRRTDQMLSRLAKHVSGRPGIARAGKIVGKRGSWSTRRLVVVGQTEGLLSI
jgi:hypothetical protein